RKPRGDEENFISIPDITVSRRHAEIASFSKGKKTIRDLGSMHGTWILRSSESEPEKVGEQPIEFSLSDQILLGGNGTVEEAIALKFGKDGKILNATPLVSTPPPFMNPIEVVHQRSDLPEDKIISRHPNGKIAELHLFWPQRHYKTEFPRGSIL